MLQKRFNQDEESESNGSGLAAMETARSAAESVAKPTEKHEEGISIFWRVFGGTMLSIVALVSITLYNSISSNIAELRGELNREREARADMVKKDEFNTRTTSQYERMRSFESFKADLEGLKERVNGNAATVDAIKKDGGANLDSLKKDFALASEAMRKDFAALEVVKERVAAIETLKKDVVGLELFRERLTTATADLKTIRDELSKLQQEVDRNKVGDLERKTSRDGQYKHVEESLKELQKALQECREKLARLEGPQPATPPGGAKPVTSKKDG